MGPYRRAKHDGTQYIGHVEPPVQRRDSVRPRARSSVHRNMPAARITDRFHDQSNGALRRSIAGRSTGRCWRRPRAAVGEPKWLALPYRPTTCLRSRLASAVGPHGEAFAHRPIGSISNNHHYLSRPFIAQETGISVQLFFGSVPAAIRSRRVSARDRGHGMVVSSLVAIGNGLEAGKCVEGETADFLISSC